jgi:hypothetical protein
MCNNHFMLGQTAVVYIHTCIHSHTRNTFTHAQCFVNIHEKTHTHLSDESPVKTPAGRAENWLLDNQIFLYRGETES